MGKKRITGALFLGICFICLFSCKAYASDIADIERARQGVVALFSGVEDKSGNFHRVKNACGCIVSSSDNSNYIITAYNAVHISEEAKSEYAASHQLDAEQIGGDTVMKLVVEGDIMVDISVVAESEKKDFILLKADSVINERGALPLGDTGALNPGDDVYVMGFSECLAKTENAGYEMSELLFYKGTLESLDHEADVAAYLQHTAYINAGNTGGALLDADGYLIGLNNLAKSDAKGKQYVSLSMDEIRTILDNYGIAYIDKQQDAEFMALRGLYEECEGLYASGTYKGSSLKPLEEALKSAQELIRQENRDSEAIAAQKELLEQAKGALKEKTPLLSYLIYGLAAVLAALLVWAAVLAVDCKNKNWYREG